MNNYESGLKGVSYKAQSIIFIEVVLIFIFTAIAIFIDIFSKLSKSRIWYLYLIGQ